MLSIQKNKDRNTPYDINKQKFKYCNSRLYYNPPKPIAVVTYFWGLFCHQLTHLPVVGFITVFFFFSAPQLSHFLNVIGGIEN